VIDLALIRKDPERARAGLKARGGRYLPALEELIAVDVEYRKALAIVEELRAKRNAASQEIGKAKAQKDEAAAQKVMSEVATLKEKMTRLEAELTPLAEKARLAALGLPNLPHESVPLGGSEEDNKEIRRIGNPPAFSFKPLDHQALGEKLGVLDMAAAAKLSGSRFALWKGAGARLMRAIATFQLDRHVKNGYLEIAPPYLVRPEILEGTGQLPKFGEQLYKTQTDDTERAQPMYLIPTAEVPLTNLVRESILANESLPMKLTAYSPCFRQEAGSYGKDVRGLIRNHQFDKVELVWITRPEESLAALEQLTKDAESILAELELPYRVLALCTGDIGPAARKTYDIEIWMPSEGKYREISSCSDCGDYQARRMEARFRRQPKGVPELVHTLNGSGVAVGRLFAAILENFQQKDGGVRIPKALQPFFGAESIAAA
jgi:seryl-tRNA synthetase